MNDILLSLMVVLYLGMVFARCMCCNTCVIFSDDFSTDRTGTDYTIVSGTPVVSSGKLYTSSATFLIVENTAGSTGHGKVRVTISTDTSTDTFSVIGSYVDSNNYIRATANLSSAVFQLVKRVAGVDTQLGVNISISSATATDYDFCLSWNGTHADASLRYLGNHVSYHQAYTGTGNQAGMSASTGGTVGFDDFAFNKHYDDDSTCATCKSADDDDGVDTCIIFQDGFATAIANRYAVGGGASASGGVLLLPASAAVDSVSKTPEGSLGHYVMCRVKMPDTTAVVRVYGSSTVFGTIQAGSPGTITIADAGTTYQTSSPTLAADQWFNVCISGDNSGGGGVGVVKFSVGSTSLSHTFGAALSYGSLSASVHRTGAGGGNVSVDDLMLMRHEADQTGCGSCTAAASEGACTGGTFVIIIYNSNSAKDDTFAITLNGTNIGSIDNSTNTCTGRIFAADATITAAITSGVITCGAPNFEATVDISGNMPVAGANTLKITSTGDMDNGNFGTVYVGYLRFGGTTWTICRTLLRASYFFPDGVGNGNTFSFQYP